MVSKKSVVFLLLVFGISFSACRGTPQDDMRQRVIYSVMIDRFMDAEKNTYNQWFDPDCQCFKKISGVPSESDPSHTNPYRFWGGDLKGITEVVKSGFLDELGITMLHITPFFQNSYFAPDLWRFTPYHGYYVEDWYRVDPRFGTTEQIKELASLLKEKNIGLMMDVVYNHSNDRCNPYSFGRVLKDGQFLFDVRGEWQGGNHFTKPDAGYIDGSDDQTNSLFGVLRNNVARHYKDKDGRVTVEFKKNKKEDLWPPLPCTVNGETQMSGLADFKMEDAQNGVTQSPAGNYIIEAMKHWAALLKGPALWFRMDASGFVEPRFTNYMINVVTGSPQAKDAKFLLEMIPSTAHPFSEANPQQAAEVAWKQQHASPLMKNFRRGRVSLYDDLTRNYLDALSRNGFTAADSKTLMDYWSVPPSHPDTYLAAYLSTHDSDRLVPENPAMKRILTTLILTAPRIPYIYYGEEGADIQPIPNGGWIDNTRGFMGPEGLQKARHSQNFQIIKKLSDLRAHSPVLYRGGLKVLQAPTASSGALIYERYEKGQRPLLVVMNGRPQTASWEEDVPSSLADGIYSDILAGNNNGLSKIQIRDGRIIAAWNAQGRALAKIPPLGASVFSQAD